MNSLTLTSIDFSCQHPKQLVQIRHQILRELLHEKVVPLNTANLIQLLVQSIKETGFQLLMWIKLKQEITVVKGKKTKKTIVLKFTPQTSTSFPSFMSKYIIE